MGISGAIALYFIVWWLTLFAMLPIGVRSQHEGDTSQDEVVEGADPGAPAPPHDGKEADLDDVGGDPGHRPPVRLAHMMD